MELGVGEVAQTETGGLGTGQRAAVGQALAGEHAGPLVAQLLVLAEEIADLTGTHTDVAGGHVGVGADVAVQLIHKGLAETHDLPVALTLGVEVRAALAAAHGQSGQSILEDLLKAQELDDRQVDGGVQTQTALVGANGGVELDTVAAVDLHHAVVVHPGHPEENGPLRLHHTAHNVLLLVAGIGLHHGLQRLQNFLHSLEELLLMTVAGLQALHDGLQISVIQRHVCQHPFYFESV